MFLKIISIYPEKSSLSSTRSSALIMFLFFGSTYTFMNNSFQESKTLRTRTAVLEKYLKTYWQNSTTSSISLDTLRKKPILNPTFVFLIKYNPLCNYKQKRIIMKMHLPPRFYYCFLNKTVHIENTIRRRDDFYTLANSGPPEKPM